MPTGEITRPAPEDEGCRAPFEPGAALQILDGLPGNDLGVGSAWDAAWIACLTNSPRWAEAARREFALVMARPGPGPV